MSTNETDLTNEFKECLTKVSHSRAGWDYDLPREQRAKEDREEKEAMARAREIWSANTEIHDHLLNTFRELQPLATLDEVTKP